MFDLLKPEIRVESEGLDYVHIVAEPLEKGFGNTVGNALRRVLLASLPGAAITSVRIDGIDHEFSTKDGMKEDMTEFLLNLKEVRLRAFSDRPARLFLEVSGEGPITASQIEVTADYEIVNPDFVLANLEGADTSLVADLNVETGRGYVPATVSEGLPIGMIPVDAIFTPIRRVNFGVSNTRVGQDTNYDRLDLEIWTDGTMDGQQAVTHASDILREQFSTFQLLITPVEEEVIEIEEPVEPDRTEMPIEQLQLSVRAYNCLRRSGLMTVAMVLEKSEEELLALRNFGEKSYFELRDKLINSGFPPPRIDSYRDRNDSWEDPATPIGIDNSSTSASENLANTNTDEVGALGAALVEALKQAGRESDN